ncbi:MAG: hypothetical protein Q7R95_09415, partial [bacterium]|nr:hypothetical protein [bacterium]
NFGEDTGSLTYEDTDISSDDVKNGEYCYYTIATQADGHMAWSSPIWFNYGRTRTIDITQIGQKTSDIMQPILLSNSATTNSPDLSQRINGTISGVPLFINTPSLLPASHINSLLKNDSVRQTYLDKKIFVKEVGSSQTDNAFYYDGFRLNFKSDTGANIIYGTHYVKFQESATGFQVFDGSINGTGIGDARYKLLVNDNSDLVSQYSPKSYRSYLFGGMWVYSASGNFKGLTFGLSGESIKMPDGTNEMSPIIMKPFIHDESNVYHLFYTSANVQYPENNVAKVLYENKTSTTIGSEATGGISSSSEWPKNLKIYYRQSAGNNLSFNSDPIRIATSNIYYPNSPCLVKHGAGDYRLYFLGYTKPDGYQMNLYCYQFTSFENIAGGTLRDICFVFNTSKYGLHNFIPRFGDAISNEQWPVDPFYAIPHNWLSVAQMDNGTYYAFFNFINSGARDETNQRNKYGVGILFSKDGIVFADQSSGNALTPFYNIRYPHVFKYSFGGVNEWYIVYADASGRLGYSKMNWHTKFVI